MPVHFTLADIDPETLAQKEKINVSSLGCSYLKKKVEELYDLDTPAANIFTATDMMLRKYAEKVKIIDDLVAINEKNSLKLEKAKRKTKVLEAILSRRSNQDLEAFEANKIPISEAKQDAAVAVLEARILMATEAAENGLDTSLWDIKGWMDKLAKMKEDYSPNPFFIGLGGSKAPKRKATKAPKAGTPDMPIKDDASSSKNDEDMAVAGDAVDSEESSG